MPVAVKTPVAEQQGHDVVCAPWPPHAQGAALRSGPVSWILEHWNQLRLANVAKGTR